MAKSYTVISDKGYKVIVTLNPEPTGPNQQIKVSYSCQNVYQYSASDTSASIVLAYRFDGDNWVTANNNSTITTPSNAQSLQIRLGYTLKIWDIEYRQTNERKTYDYVNWHLVKSYTIIDGVEKEVLRPTWDDRITRTTYDTVETEYVAYSNSGTWYSDSIILNNNPSISGIDTDLGEKSTAFSIEYSVNDTDSSDAIAVECYYDDVLVSTIENAIRGHKYQFMISNAMLAPSAINSVHTIKIIASDGKGATTRTYTFVKNRNPEPYMDYTINPVQTDGMATTIVVGQLYGKDQNFQKNIYVCNNAFDAQPMWEDMSGQYYQGLSYNFVNTAKTADRWGVSVRFVNSKFNENDQIDIAGCGFWCDKMIVRN